MEISYVRTFETMRIHAGACVSSLQRRVFGRHRTVQRSRQDYTGVSSLTINGGDSSITAKNVDPGGNGISILPPRTSGTSGTLTVRMHTAGSFAPPIDKNTAQASRRTSRAAPLAGTGRLPTAATPGVSSACRHEADMPIRTLRAAGTAAAISRAATACAWISAT